MKLLTFKQEGQEKVGVKTTDGIVDLKKAAKWCQQDVPLSVKEIIKQGTEALQVIQQIVKEMQEEKIHHVFVQENDVKFGPCVPNPGKIICVGLNYKKHATESKMTLPKEPLLFSKFTNAIAAHQDVIEIPIDATKIDYEAELVIVIGKKGKYITKDEAFDYIFGYCNGNDVSARDLQMRTSQWLLGKSCDGFCPIGPYLVTKDEIDNPNHLNIALKVNGEIRQSSNTKLMIFSCEELISYISRYMTIEPGDIIFTGTPEGVILGEPADNQKWLQSGDEVIVEIEKLGSLHNKIK